MNYFQKAALLCREFFQYEKALREIRKTTEDVKERYRKSGKLTVVFMMQFLPAWVKLRPIYEELKKDDRFRPVLLCIPDEPDHEKALKNGSENNEVYRYLKDNGYEAVNAVTEKGEWFDLSSLQPSFVFKARPYNAQMPLCYQSESLRKYALICVVLYASNISVDGQKVTLNRDYFKDVFCYYAFNKYDRDYYEKRFSLGIRRGIQKCLPYGALGIQEILSKKPLHPVSRPRTVIWTPRWSTDPKIGGSNFFRYKELLFRFAKENPEILFIFRPHPLMFRNFRKTGEMTEQEEADFRAYCQSAGNIRLDEEKEYVDTFWNSDLLVTDVSAIFTDYYVTGKPVIFCHSDVEYHYSDYTLKMLKTVSQVNNEGELSEALEAFIDGKDPERENRQAVLSDLFPEVDVSSRKVRESLTDFVKADGN